MTSLTFHYPASAWILAVMGSLLFCYSSGPFVPVLYSFNCKKLLFFFNLFMRLLQVLVAAPEIFCLHWGMQDL